MRHSLESLSHSSNLDMPKDPEGINRPNNPKDPWDMSDFRKGIEELKKLIDDLPTTENEDEREIGGDQDVLKTREQLVEETREKVLACFGNNNRIEDAKNRVFETKFGPSYNDNPNVFRTNEQSVYRITGINQIVDIVNSGYVRPKEGKLKGGHENEVFWSKGGQALNYIDERPIIEASVESVQDGQEGSLSLEDLSAVWIFNPDTKKRENKLEVLKESRKLLDKDEQITEEKLIDRLKNGISSSDISDSF